jgi:N-acetyl-gamma-glutamyl-phosphate reductase
MKALVVGGSGYTGGEVLRMLLGHPRVEKVEATSRSAAGKPVCDTHQNLRGIFDGKFSEYDPGNADADVAFLAVPHGEAMEYAPGLLDRGVKVVDLSADYRFSDPALYERAYGKHKNPELLKEAAYGLPELFRQKIKKARLVANPGCYTTAAILALVPLSAYKDRIDAGKIVVDAKSGTSGGGAKPTEFFQHSEVEGGLKVYKAVGHRHQPEIEHIVSGFIPGASVSFTPTLAPITRGILSNAHVFGDLSGADIRAHYMRYYKGERFVRVVEAANTKAVEHSNYCDISPFYDPQKKRAVIVSAIDNLVKGAAGQAVQNMNLIMGFGEGEGVDGIPYHP